MKTRTVRQNGITIHHVVGNIPLSFWSESYHSHDHAEVFIHVRGQMELFIENSVYHHNSNEIRIYAPGELHFGRCVQEMEMEWYQISLPSSFLEENPTLACRITDRKKGRGNIFISKKQETLISLLEEIFVTQGSILAEHYLYADLIKILCILNEPEYNIDVEMGKNESLQSILELVNDNLPEVRTVNDIAALTHFSPSYVHQLFKRYLNITPHGYLTVKRMEMARDLLAGGISVSEACFAAGFSSYPNFITAFKKYFGVTPKNYAKANV